ncbi:hypothetical protein IC608_16990 [Devosia sp. PTR5]|uniref:HAMP domain-containing protein n=1 Tax=Devosia oryzisoli TaxID=2774138 RepID=A0A927FXX8_9HYPH|nr:cache domain-containing protein [Devosia oryzisoli]MBD8067169.1 hypothetical protein [Devosia oryzisoli]
MKLRSLLFLVLGVILAGGFLALALIFNTNLTSYSAATSRESVRVRTQALGTFLSRSLHEEWQRVERAAEQAPGDLDVKAAEAVVARLEQDIGKMSWIGVADRNGTVLAASQDMLVGESVGQRQWFQQGLAGPFAGDVHEAVLLAKLLETNNDDPIRFIDFSAPIRNGSGAVVGVIGTHINWKWVEQLVTEASQVLQLHTFIVSRSGDVVLQTDPAEGDISRLRSFRAATLGVKTTELENWPDGQTYLTATVPQVTYGTLPSFGWNMIARLDQSFIDGADNGYRTRMLAAALGIFLLVLVVFGSVTALILRPLRSLAENLQRLAHGEPTPFVRQHRRFREATILSDAVVLLQSRNAEASAKPSAHGSSDNPAQ